VADRTYTIGQAAGAAGVGVETIRYYERQGLIERPAKPAQGARRYPQATVDRIRALRQGQALGLSLAQTNALLALQADPGADCHDVHEQAQAHLADIEHKRARLGEIADKLHELIAACPGQGATHECAILEAFMGSAENATDDAPAASAGTRVELHVRGIACGGCAARVRTLLREAPGVAEAHMDQVTGIARLRIDPAITDTQALATLLTDAGFTARPSNTATPIHDP